MAAELKTRILLDLAGNYGAQMQAFDKLTAKFASGAQYSMGVAATRVKRQPKTFS